MEAGLVDWVVIGGAYMKNKFRFQIQSSLDVEVEGDASEEARRELIDNLKNYADEMITACSYVSDGVEVK